LAHFFDEVQLTENNTIMIPGEQAMKLADLAVKMFCIK
jgi:hypothetical protein